MRLIELITEGLSPVLYHYTNTNAALDIIKSNSFKLAASSGTHSEEQLRSGDRVYYLSTTRHKMGGYHLDNNLTGVMLNLDGKKLGERYKGKPVDYWGPDWYGAGRKGYETREAEDRVYSVEPRIPNAKQYIQEVHVLFSEQGQKYHKEKAGVRNRRLLIAAKAAGIPVYIYEDPKAWLIQNKSKAVNPKSIAMLGTGDAAKDLDQRGYQRRRNKDFAGWLELYHVNDSDKLTSASKLQYGYITRYPHEGVTQLANDIHNNKTKPESGLTSLLRIMRKEKLTSPKEYVEFLEKKWAAEYEAKRES